eukprot:15778-Eustigmatos_ZCMA.PRE.1
MEGSYRLDEPLEVLRKWDYNTSKESVAMTLAHYYGTLVYERMNRKKGFSFMELMYDWVNIQGDYVGQLSLFQEAVETLQKDFGTWKMPWGE